MLRRLEHSVLRDDVMASRQLAGRVRRYHTWPVHHVQTVGEHSARVATLYVELFGLPRAEVLYFILHHDSGELSAGDSPYPSKQRFPDLKRGVEAAEAEGLQRLKIELPDLADWERHRFKVCDLIEMHEFGVSELMMGNRYAEPIVRDTWDAVHAYAKENIYDDYNKIWSWMTVNGVDLT